MTEEKGYRNIFKSTFLFGFVQVFNILIKVIYNKIAALILGPSGIGLIGLFQNTTNMLKTGCGLGIPQSAVKDIAEAHKERQKEKIGRIIKVTDKVVNITSALGVMLTAVLSPFLSKWTIGNYEYTYSYLLLSLSTGLLILSEGKLAILKGLRRLRDLAKANMIGSVAGLFIGIPFYYFLGENGIVPSLILFSLASYLVVKLYINKTNYSLPKISLKNIISDSKEMVKMGIALMIVSFATLLFNVIISFYISSRTGLAEVGIYNAGVTIISSYFGIVITAMTTDYYPRISAINKNNDALQTELNRQSEVGLILVFPLVVIFIFFSSLFIKILYDSSFESSNQYTNYALIGTIIIIVSNSMGMILLAKQATKVFLCSTFFQRILLLGVYIILYNYWGLLGLGIAYIITGIVHIGTMHFILKKKYNILLNSKVKKLLCIILSFSLLMIVCRSIENTTLKYFMGTIGIVSSILFSLRYCKKELNIDIIGSIKSHL